MRGLLGFQPLGTGEGLFIERCNSVHTVGMGYAIDVAFVDRNMFVLHEIHSMKPYRLSAVVWNATAAIELPAGTLAASNTRDGHQLVLEQVTADTAP